MSKNKALVITVQVLPDMTDWQPYGSVVVDGKDAQLWQYKEMAGEKVNTYSFYVTEVRWRWGCGDQIGVYIM